MKFLDAFVIRIKQALDFRDLGGGMRKCSKKKEAFVEAEKLTRIVKFKSGYLGEKPLDGGGMAGTEVVFGGIELRKETIELM
jgi:hypothetical protein